MTEPAIDGLGRAIMTVVGAASTWRNNGVRRFAAIHVEVCPQIICFMNLAGHDHIGSGLAGGVFKLLKLVTVQP